MGTARTYVVSFDVCNMKRLRKLSRFLCSKGQRVQKSVFEIIATEREMSAILEEAIAKERFDSSMDRLRCYPLGDEARKETRVFGVSMPVQAPAVPLIV